MNNLDLLFQASLLVEAKKLHEVDKFSVVSKDLKSSIGGRMTAWTILRELLCSAECTIQSAKEGNNGRSDNTQLKRYLGDFSNLVSIILQLYTQEVEFLHAVKRQIVDVFSAKNDLLQSYGKLGCAERKAQAAEEKNDSSTNVKSQSNQERCAVVQDRTPTEASACNSKNAVCKEATKAKSPMEGMTSTEPSRGGNGRLKIKIPINTINEINEKVKVSVTKVGKQRSTHKLREKSNVADKDLVAHDPEPKRLEEVEGPAVLKENDEEAGKPNDKTMDTTKQVRAEVCGATTRSLRRNRKRRSLETDNEVAATKRRRINWTAEENKLFIELVSKFQPLGEPEMRRRVARHFSPRRTHEQCANHLRILRAKGVIPNGDDQGAIDGGAVVTGCGHTSRDTSVTLSKDSQSS